MVRLAAPCSSASPFAASWVHREGRTPPSPGTPLRCTARRRCPAARARRRPSRPVPPPTPAAPKGGRLVQGVLGTFDSLNPLIVKGIAPPSIRGYVVESLMARGYDEPFTLYGLIARSVETDA